MSATPMPETGQPSDERPASLPFSLYFEAKDAPHWSKVSDGKDAEPGKKVEKDRRIRQIAGLHDTIHQLKDAVNALVSFDRNGLVDEAAENLRRTAVRVNNRIDTILADIAVVRASYLTNERAATTPPPADEEEAFEAAADERAADQVLTALAARMAEGDEVTVAVARAVPHPTPADIAAAAERGIARRAR